MMIILLFSLGLAGFAVSMIMMSEHFKKVVDIEFLQFQDQWKKDGRPAGGKATKAQDRFF